MNGGHVTSYSERPVSESVTQVITINAIYLCTCSSRSAADHDNTIPDAILC